MSKAKKPPGEVHTVNGRTLVVMFEPNGTRTFFCAAYPDLPGRYNGTTDGTAAVDEFERRASAGESMADESTKGAA